jgi:hypothetical protein
LGLYAEREGDLRGAEADLLEAAHVDRQYVPAWTLANFYFRQKDPAKFWAWARRAAALTFDDYRPLVRLMDAMAASPKEAMEQFQDRAPPVLRAYLDLLIGAGRWEAAEQVASMLAARNDPADHARLADFAARRRRSDQP